MEFRVLGPLEVVREGQAVRLTSARQRVLLAALLCRPGDIVSADTLMDLLWGDEQPARGRKSLQVHVHRLRRVVGDADLIAFKPPGYRLAVEPDQLDLLRFEALADRGRAAIAAGDTERGAALLREALGLWRGDAFGGVADIEPVTGERMRLEEMRVKVIEERMEAELALGRHGEVVAELTGLVRANPLRGGLRGLLMLALYRSSRAAEALEVYREGRALMVEELGMEPDTGLRALHEAILAEDPALMPAPVARSEPVEPAERADEEPKEVRPNASPFGLGPRGGWALLAAVGAAGVLGGSMMFSGGGSPAPRPKALASTTSVEAKRRILVNDSRWVAVAATFSRDGGACPPLSPSPEHPRCGTCDVPSRISSGKSCAALFADVDAFTFDKADFSLDKTEYKRHTYVRVQPGTLIRCGSGVRGPVCHSEVSPA